MIKINQCEREKIFSILKNEIKQIQEKLNDDGISTYMSFIKKLHKMIINNLENKEYEYDYDFFTSSQELKNKKIDGEIIDNLFKRDSLANISFLISLTKIELITYKYFGVSLNSIYQIKQIKNKVFKCFSQTFNFYNFYRIHFGDKIDEISKGKRNPYNLLLKIPSTNLSNIIDAISFLLFSLTLENNWENLLIMLKKINLSYMLYICIKYVISGENKCNIKEDLKDNINNDRELRKNLIIINDPIELTFLWQHILIVIKLLYLVRTEKPFNEFFIKRDLISKNEKKNYNKKIQEFDSIFKQYCDSKSYNIISKTLKIIENLIEKSENIDNDSVFKNPILILTGGTDKKFKNQIDKYKKMIISYLTTFNGTIISGGTKDGIAGWPGELQEIKNSKIIINKKATNNSDRIVNKKSLITIGYLPKDNPWQVQPDNRYTYLIKTRSTDFSITEPLIYWFDLIRNPIIKLDEIITIGINGGLISSIEYRLAILFNSKVIFFKNSGRALDTLINDPLWSILLKKLEFKERIDLSGNFGTV